VPKRIPLWRLRPTTLYTFSEVELEVLDERTALILRMRSGMVDGRLYSLSEVGEKVGVTAERVRVLQNEGLSIIRQVREIQRRMRTDPPWPECRLREEQA